MSLSLPNVTLLIADCINAERAVKVVEHCKSKATFGAIKLLTSLPCEYEHAIKIQHLPTLNDYSSYMLTKAVDHVETPYVLTVQHDGFILNEDAWHSEWNKLDYIGPLFIHRHVIDSRSVGSGGFSYRSRALMEAVRSFLPPWSDEETGTSYQSRVLTCYEDGMIAYHFRNDLEARGFRYATPAQAARFAFGGQCDPAYVCEKPFGFHGYWSNIDFKNARITGDAPESPSTSTVSIST